MRVALLAVVAGLAILWAAPALAQPACSTQGSTDAHGMAFTNVERIMTVSISGTAEINTPDVVVDAKPACLRPGLTVNGTDYAVSGENDDRVVRRAAPKSGEGKVVMLVTAKAVPEAHFVLLTAEKGLISIHAYFDKIPDDATFARIAAAMIGGSGPPPMVTENRANKKIQVFVPTPAQPAAKPQTAAIRDLGGPDGIIFLDQGAGAVRHALTGFVCPAAVDQAVRTRITVFDASEGGRDVGCNFGGEADGAWYTIYLSRLPGVTPQQYMQASIKDAQNSVPATGEAKSLIDAGPAPLPSDTYFWMSKKGKEGLLVRKAGDWALTIRVTILPGNDDKALPVLQHLIQMLSAVGDKAI
jgi:hypothetical protein